MNFAERILEKTLFASRWLLTPFYIGLVLCIFLLAAKFVMKFIGILGEFSDMSGGKLVVDVLGLIDLALIANLIIIIAFSSYESFVSRMDVENHEDRPAWLGKLGFADLKIKVVGSIIAISAIELLRVFIELANYSTDQVMWKVIIHATFVFSGVMFAISDYLSKKKN